MGEILDLKTIHDYNKFLGLETLNPLVGFVDFSKVEVHWCLSPPDRWVASTTTAKHYIRKVMPYCFIPTLSEEHH